jgi:hypothetical protein
MDLIRFRLSGTEAGEQGMAIAKAALETAVERKAGNSQRETRLRSMVEASDRDGHLTFRRDDLPQQPA